MEIRELATVGHTSRSSLRVLALALLALFEWVVARVWGGQRAGAEGTRFGSYTLGGKLGEGGMGVVYRATDGTHEREAAIKLLSVPDAGGLRRFEREARVMERLNHSNVAAVYEHGKAADGTPYYAMELLEGLDLQRLVDGEGAQRATRVVHILIQAAAALAAAHEAGIVHRDIKPSNLFLCGNTEARDSVKVLDFGLAKELRTEDPAQTAEGVILGTPHNLAPECLVDPAKAGPAADLYALGTVAYLLLVGQPVFEGRSVVELCAHHLHSKPASISERARQSVSRELERVVLSCLEKAPSARPASAAQLLDALRACPEADGWSAEDAEAWWVERDSEGRLRSSGVSSIHSMSGRREVSASLPSTSRVFRAAAASVRNSAMHGAR